MSNLGQYEVITTEAKLAGGVDAWLKIIEDAAVAERSSEYLAKGAVIGVVLTTGALGTGVRRPRSLGKESATASPVRRGTPEGGDHVTDRPAAESGDDAPGQSDE